MNLNKQLKYINKTISYDYELNYVFFYIKNIYLYMHLYIHTHIK